MIIPALMAFVSCVGKRKKLSFEFFGSLRVLTQLWDTSLSLVTISGPLHLWDISQCSASRGQLKGGQVVQTAKQISLNSEGRLHVVRKGSP